MNDDAEPPEHPHHNLAWWIVWLAIAALAAFGLYSVMRAANSGEKAGATTRMISAIRTAMTPPQTIQE
jgi:hypothetical protein